jgi:hypothetical protein
MWQAGEHLAAVLGKAPLRLSILDGVWAEEQLPLTSGSSACAPSG